MMSVSAAEPRSPTRKGEDSVLQYKTTSHNNIHKEGGRGVRTEKKSRESLVDDPHSGTYATLASIYEFIH